MPDGRHAVFEIFCMGCDAVEADGFEVDRPDGWGDGCYLMLFIKTRAYMTVGGVEIMTEPNTFIVYNKRSYHKYRSCGGVYVNDWMEFDAPNNFTDSLSISFDTPITITGGHEREISSVFRSISDTFYSRSRRGAETCSLLMQAMLSMVSDLCPAEKRYGRYHGELLELRREIYGSPDRDWKIADMAKRFHLNKSYFQEIYRSTFGTSCGADIINSRVECAKGALLNTDKSMSEIAETCGYGSAVHFSRQFASVTGCPPTTFRKKYRTEH